MNIVNYKIKHTILELGVTVLFLAISIPLWINFSNKPYASIAKSYASSVIVDLINVEPLDDAISVINSNEISSVKGAHYMVKNYSGTSDAYKLVLKVSKSSDINYLNVSINNVNSKLIELEKEEDSEYYYFTLDKNVVKDYDINNYYLKFWINKDEIKNVVSSQLNYSFILI